MVYCLHFQYYDHEVVLMNKKTLGIREIAHLAGVSVATVSRVINNPEKTSPETREKVSEVIRKYNYTPNITAKHLFSGASNSFALFVFDLDNPFFISLINALSDIALDNQCSLLICSTQSDPERERAYLHYCESIRTNGIILTEGYIDPRNFSQTSQRLVFLDRQVDDKHIVFRSDNVKGTSYLIDYLYNLGHRKIAFAGQYEDFGSVSQRFQGYLRSLQEKGLPLVPEYLFEGPPMASTGVVAFDYFCALKDRPTAIVCSCDTVAQGLCMRAAQFGFNIPGDFSVTGFDGCLPEYYYPRITTIRQDYHKLAKRLFHAVFDENPDTLKTTLDVSLLVGDSCRKVAGEGRK